MRHRRGAGLVELLLCVVLFVLIIAIGGSVVTILNFELAH